MADINPEFIEKYQILYQKDPSSKVFAPLAEAYRKLKMLNEALGVAQKGVKEHPYFASGRMALAKVLLDLDKKEEALEHLKKISEISPENILAYTLLAKIYMQLRKPREALKAYKMLLFLNPNHETAKAVVKKLESLEAEDFVEEVFSFKNLHTNKSMPEIIQEKQDKEPQNAQQEQRYLERSISLSDAYIVRNDYEKAKTCLLSAKEKLGKQPEIEKRLMIISEREQINEKPILNTGRKKIAFLERLLLRIDQKRSLA